MRMNRTRRAASSLMIILAWVYYSVLIFFLGAELTCMYAHEHGSRIALLSESSPRACEQHDGGMGIRLICLAVMYPFRS